MQSAMLKRVSSTLKKQVSLQTRPNHDPVKYTETKTNRREGPEKGSASCSSSILTSTRDPVSVCCNHSCSVSKIYLWIVTSVIFVWKDDGVNFPSIKHAAETTPDNISPVSVDVCKDCVSSCRKRVFLKRHSRKLFSRVSHGNRTRNRL